MKTCIHFLTGSILAIAAQNAWAVQGNLQSSSGFVASTVGGATVAQFTNEFDAVIDNPAMMQFTKTSPGTHKFSLGLEFASYPNSFNYNNEGYQKGSRDTAYIPFAAYFYNINENFKFGTGLYAIGGTGYDYTSLPQDPEDVSELYSEISIPLAVSYKICEQVNIGASLNLVGSQIEFNNFGAKSNTESAFNITPSVGATYNPGPVVIGADFSLGTTATFKNLGYSTTTKSAYDVKVGTPTQFALGIGRNAETYSYGFKYRFVDWTNTENYKQLSWKNQHTFSLGGQYNLSDAFIGRAGLYYVTSVYQSSSNVSGDSQVTYQGQATPTYLIEFSNAMGYGMPQWQYALGAGYKITPKSIFDFGIVYEPQVAKTFSGSSTKFPGGTFSWQKKNSNLQIFLTFSQEV